MQPWHQQPLLRKPASTRECSWFTVAVILIVSVPVTDYFLPPDIHIAHTLVLPVALVAVFFGPRRTALTAGLAAAALIAAGVERRTLSTEPVLVELGSFVALSVVLIVVSHVLERRRQEVVGLRRVSEAVLRPLPPQAGPISIASAYRAADNGTPVGGDLYAVARTADSTRLLIGDVRGKGLASVGDTELVLGAFRAAAHRQSPLPELAASLEGSVRWGLNEHWDTAASLDAAERFVTAAIIEIPDDDPYVHVINCGHLPPLLFHGGTVTPLDTVETAPPLGLGALASTGYTPSTFPFAAGDRLLMYTDGVTEARNPEGEFYPLLKRAAAWADDRYPGSLVEALTADLRMHARAGLNDDMAVVALQRDVPQITGVPEGETV